MDKFYFIEYYELERKHWWFRVREQIIIDRVKEFFGDRKREDLKILNVGVATARTSEALSALGNVTSIENDPDCSAYARSKTGLDIITGSILELPFKDGEFDLVCAFDVIEHVDDDQKAVLEMKRVCKKGGVVFITVPAFQSLWSHHDVVNHHFRRYRMKQIDKLFSGTRDKVLIHTYFNSILFIPIFLVRFTSNLFPKYFLKKNPGSDFTLINQDSFANRMSYAIFSLERKLLNFMRFPFGVSIMYAEKK